MFRSFFQQNTNDMQAFDYTINPIWPGSDRVKIKLIEPQYKTQKNILQKYFFNPILDGLFYTLR